MSVDSITISAVRDELRQTVLGGRVQRVVQAGATTYAFEIYAQHRRRWLLVSGDPEHARIHLASEKVGRADDRVSPMLLLFRKHLRRARLIQVEQPDFERCLRLGFAHGPAQVDEPEEAAAEDAEEASSGSGVTVIIEAIGRYGNVVLVGADEVILDAAKRITSEVNRYRVVLPKQPYVPPPPQEKAPLSALDASGLAGRLAAAPPKTTAAQCLVAAYAGLSPQVAREAVHRACGRANAAATEVEPAEVVDSLRGILASRDSGEWSPSVVEQAGRIIAFAPYRLTQHEGQGDREVRPVESISGAIDAYYSQIAQVRPVDQARHVAKRSLLGRRETLARKAASLERALEGGQRGDLLRSYGEAILAHLPEIRRGQDRLVADGLEVPLDPALSPVENAQRHFKRYRKAKAALAGVPSLLAETRLSLDFLDQALAHLDLADTADQVRAVQREVSGRKERSVRAARPGRRPPARVDRRADALAGVERYFTSDGLEVLVGRSGRQNDAVTFELARPEDVWLHARGVPGAHVILRVGAGEPSQAGLGEAAALAAHFSAARGATGVPVDWTRRRNVRRIREALPGLVSYVGERTLQVRRRCRAASRSRRADGGTSYAGVTVWRGAVPRVRRSYTVLRRYGMWHSP